MPSATWASRMIPEMAAHSISAHVDRMHLPLHEPCRAPGNAPPAPWQRKRTTSSWRQAQLPMSQKWFLRSADWPTLRACSPP
eukprot:scaffold27367_cov112-Isochrysis_galbana.AAC.6